MHRLLTDDLDLRHQVSVPASQIATLQTGMDAQLGSVTAQMVNLAQQVARVNSRANGVASRPSPRPSNPQLGRQTSRVPSRR